MLQLYIDSIDEKGVNLNKRLEGEDFALLQSLSRKGDVAFRHPVHVQIHASIVDDTLLIRAAVETVAQLPCSRCLKPFELPIETDFTVAASPKMPEGTHTRSGDELELKSEEMDLLSFTGNRLDLMDEVSQQIILALPIKPLCAESCKGLCSRCGADLNRASCQCDARAKNNPFAALGGLAFPPKKE